MAERHDAVRRLAAMPDAEAADHVQKHQDDADPNAVAPDRAAPSNYDVAVTATCCAAPERSDVAREVRLQADAVLAVLAARDEALNAQYRSTGRRGRPRLSRLEVTARAVMVAAFRVNPDVDEGAGPVVASVADALGVTGATAAKALNDFHAYVGTLEFRQAMIQAMTDAAAD